MFNITTLFFCQRYGRFHIKTQKGIHFSTYPHLRIGKKTIWNYLCGKSKKYPMAKKRSNKQKRKKSKSRNWKWKIFKYSFLCLLAIAIAGGLFIWSVYAGLWGKLPTYAELRHIQNAEASVLQTENGEIIGKYYVENRINVNYRNISVHAINALIATEDVRFYQHEGIDKISMARVFFKTFLLGKRSAGGGSTISQQLAKNLYPREEQQVTFMPVIKFKEMFIARRLENTYTKNEILTLYLNTVSFGENTFGIESAAQKYFSTSASELTLPQAATLIGMLKGPSYYNPRLHPERSLQRRNTVLNQMVKYDYLTEAEGEQLKAQKLDLRYKPDNHYSGIAPYLRERIRQDALRILKEYNATHDTHYNLYEDGLILTTTLDAEMQRYAEASVAAHLPSLQASYEKHLQGKQPWDKDPEILENAIRNSNIYKKLKAKGMSETAIRKEMDRKKPMLIYNPAAKEKRVNFSSIDSIKYYLKLFQPAFIAVEPQTGKIKAYVGGLDYKYFQYDQVTAPRQVGSVFKPVVYSAAIRHGARLDAYYSNKQETYPEYDNWTPRNADNNYEGYYTLKGALSQSVNTIAVKVLLQTGIDTVISHARRLGISAELPGYPSLALGVADIPLQEMVNPYLAFANNGKLTEQYYLLEIKTQNGDIIYRTPNSHARQVIPKEEAAIMDNILSAVIDNGTGRRLRTTYGLHNALAGKTGTTQNQVDGWFIGYTPRLVVGIRVGANNTAIHFNTIRLGQGSSMALPIFGEFMRRYTANPAYSRWNNLTFPALGRDMEVLSLPPFRERLNLMDRITNRKVGKVKTSQTDTLVPLDNPRKEGFLKRLFKRKKNKD